MTIGLPFTSRKPVIHFLNVYLLASLIAHNFTVMLRSRQCASK